MPYVPPLGQEQLPRVVNPALLHVHQISTKTASHAHPGLFHPGVGVSFCFLFPALVSLQCGELPRGPAEIRHRSGPHLLFLDFLLYPARTGYGFCLRGPLFLLRNFFTEVDQALCLFHPSERALADQVKKLSGASK